MPGEEVARTALALLRRRDRRSGDVAHVDPRLAADHRGRQKPAREHQEDAPHVRRLVIVRPDDRARTDDHGVEPGCDRSLYLTLGPRFGPLVRHAGALGDETARPLEHVHGAEMDETPDAVLFAAIDDVAGAADVDALGGRIVRALEGDAGGGVVDDLGPPHGVDHARAVGDVDLHALDIQAFQASDVASYEDADLGAVGDQSAHERRPDVTRRSGDDHGFGHCGRVIARRNWASMLWTMSTLDVRVGERLWTAATDLRRREWRALITDLAAGGALFTARAPSGLVIDLDDHHLTLVFEVDGGDTRHQVPRAELAHVIDEYRGVIDRLGDDGNTVMRMEALDMAKKVVHDDGARRIGALLPDLSDEHETRRRFFSLVVALAVDTTKRAWAHRHL